MNTIHDVEGLMNTFDVYGIYDGDDVQDAIRRLTTDKMLMSADNRHGPTLEHLLEKVIEELEWKTDKIASDSSDEARIVIQNNKAIVNFLSAALKYQQDSMNLLAKKGPEDVDKPRIGPGSEGRPLTED